MPGTGRGGGGLPAAGGAGGGLLPSSSFRRRHFAGLTNFCRVFWRRFLSLWREQGYVSTSLLG